MVFYVFRPLRGGVLPIPLLCNGALICFAYYVRMKQSAPEETTRRPNAYNQALGKAVLPLFGLGVGIAVSAEMLRLASVAEPIRNLLEAGGIEFSLRASPEWLRTYAYNIKGTGQFICLAQGVNGALMHYAAHKEKKQQQGPGIQTHHRDMSLMAVASTLALSTAWEAFTAIPHAAGKLGTFIDKFDTQDMAYYMLGAAAAVAYNKTAEVLTARYAGEPMFGAKQAFNRAASGIKRGLKRAPALVREAVAGRTSPDTARKTASARPAHRSPGL